jgi:rod shape determining protein RodA
MSQIGSSLKPSQPAKASGLLAGLHLDVPLLTGILLLCAYGLVVQYSAGGQEWGQVERQAMRMGLGLLLMTAMAQIAPDRLRRWSPGIYALSFALLAAVLIMGDIGKGAQRWLDLGVLRFQPSELAKLAVPLMVAWFLAERPLPPHWLRLLGGGLLILLPVLMIAKQPDLGTSLLVGAAGLFVIFLAGLSWRFILLLAVVAVPASLALWEWGMHDYQRNRVLTFLDPQRDPLGTGYHIIQSSIAIGSGGLYGKGWLEGTQSHLDFLPERTTDFILAVLAEEFGLNGVILLLALNLFVVMRGLVIAVRAQDAFSRLLAGTLSLVFFLYVFVNAGMVSGLLPVVGVPLPLISFGGTSMVTLMLSFGILMSIHTHRKLLPT